MTKISIFILFIAGVLTDTCDAYQLIGTAALSEALVAQHYTINPNLDAVIVVDKTIPTFEYQTFYCAGSADEAEGEQGRIHFLEHIMSGTGSQEPGKLNQIIIENGGQKRAATSIHFMYFVMRFPKDKFDLAVEIDRGRFYDTVINEEVVEHEKKIVLTERSRRLASPTNQSTNYFFSLIYKKKNIDGLGTEAFIQQLEPVGLKDYYENFLRLQKRLIVVIGDVDVEHVLAKLDEAYGSTCAMQPQAARMSIGGQADRNEQRASELSRELYSPQYPNYEVLGKKIKRTSKNLSFTRFRKGWYTPNLGHRDYAGLLILESILEKFSKSLKSSLVDSGIAKSFSVSLNSYKGFGLMNCYAELPHDTSRNTIHDMIQAELEKLKSISEAELNAARNQQLTTMYAAFYNRSSMASSFGRAFAHANDPLLYPKLIKDLKSIRREDIPRIIDQYLTDDNSITVSLTLETKKPPKKKRTALHYVIIVLTLVGFLTVLGCLVALLVWGVRRLRRKFSRKAITDETDDADERG